VVLVRGDWAYDEGHGGWNEIHPVRSVQKLTEVIDPRFRAMGKATPALVAEFKTQVLDVWCFYAGQADDPDVQDEQDRPENDWGIHPDVDGCKDRDEDEEEDADENKNDREG
jgi:hypothetical protein